MKKENTIVIDSLGDICPIPMIKFQKIEDTLSKESQIMIITDHSCGAENVINYCKLRHYKTKVVEPITGVWEIHITK